MQLQHLLFQTMSGTARKNAQVPAASLVDRIFAHDPRNSSQQSRLQIPVLRYCNSLDKRLIIRTHPPCCARFPCASLVALSPSQRPQHSLG
jgi:hypothetical protein